MLIEKHRNKIPKYYSSFTPHHKRRYKVALKHFVGFCCKFNLSVETQTNKMSLITTRCIFCSMKHSLFLTASNSFFNKLHRLSGNWRREKVRHIDTEQVTPKLTERPMPSCSGHLTPDFVKSPVTNISDTCKRSCDECIILNKHFSIFLHQGGFNCYHCTVFSNNTTSQSVEHNTLIDDENHYLSG